MKIKESKIERLLKRVQKNILLKNYTTFKIGGRAQYFFVAKNQKDLISAIKMAKKFNLPFFILGAGTNLLVSDKGYKGLVIKIQNSKIKIQKSEIKVDAGAMLGKLLNATVSVGLTGFEWAAGIPGTVGGAVLGNAGAFGKSMKDIVNEVEVFDAKTGKIKIFKNKDCKFGYRDSIFKHKKNLIILSAILQLKKREKGKIKEKIKLFYLHRKKTQPLKFPSAGSIFKNPAGSFAGKLIEGCGLKGKKIGKAQISNTHANFIINLGGAGAKDVKKLINLAKKKVKNKFGVKLEEEIRYLGF